MNYLTILPRARQLRDSRKQASVKTSYYIKLSCMSKQTIHLYFFFCTVAGFKLSLMRGLGAIVEPLFSPSPVAKYSVSILTLCQLSGVLGNFNLVDFLFEAVMLYFWLFLYVI